MKLQSPWILERTISIMVRLYSEAKVTTLWKVDCSLQPMMTSSSHHKEPEWRLTRTNLTAPWPEMLNHACLLVLTLMICLSIKLVLMQKAKLGIMEPLGLFFWICFLFLCFSASCIFSTGLWGGWLNNLLGLPDQNFGPTTLAAKTWAEDTLPEGDLKQSTFFLH